MEFAKSYLIGRHSQWPGALCILAGITLSPAALAGLGGPEPPEESHPVYELVAQLEGPFGFPQSEAGPRFGHSVAMYGDTLVVGAPDANTGVGINQIQRGLVYVFRRFGSEWVVVQTLNPTANIADAGPARCGHSVAIYGAHLIVGCPGYSSGLDDRGRVTYYQRLGASAPFESIRSIQGDQASEECGTSVTLLDEEESGLGLFAFSAFSCPGRIGMAAPDPASPALEYHGAVDIYRFLLGIGEPPNWERQDAPILRFFVLDPHDTRFGNSIHLNRHTGDHLLLAIGAPGDDSDRGRVTVYRRLNDDFGQVSWLSDGNFTGANRSQFGYSVHAHASRLMVGSPTYRLPGTRPGGGTAFYPVGAFSIINRSTAWGEPSTVIGEITCPQCVPPNSMIGLPQNRLGHAVLTLQGSVIGGLQRRFLAGEPLSPTTGANVGGRPTTFHGSGRARHYIQPIGPLPDEPNDEPFYGGFIALPDSEFGHALASNPRAGFVGGAWLAIGAPSARDSEGRHYGQVFVYSFVNEVFSDRFEE